MNQGTGTGFRCFDSPIKGNGSSLSDELVQQGFNLGCAVFVGAGIIFPDGAGAAFIVVYVVCRAARHIPVACADGQPFDLVNVEVPSINAAGISDGVMVAKQELKITITGRDETSGTVDNGAASGFVLHDCKILSSDPRGGVFFVYGNSIAHSGLYVNRVEETF
jgi:hypothetical protein